MKSDRIRHYKGTHHQIGMSIGEQFGNRLQEHIDKYLKAMDDNYGIDFCKLEKESMLWFDTLPDCYKEELNGISCGANFAIEKLAQFSYCDRCVDGGCTSFVSVVDGNAWVGRNNDYIRLDSWGYVNILEALNKIPVMLFGMEGDTFSGTGMNREKLWLHYNWLPVWDVPSFAEKPLSPFVFLRQALETCKSLNDVEYMIQNTLRDGGMNLFAVDGKTNEFAVLECGTRAYSKRQATGAYIAGANHYCVTDLPDGTSCDFSSSIARQSVVERLLFNRGSSILPDDYMRILSNPEVEQNYGLSGTVYSCVCCPAKDEIWYAGDAFPAASKGQWRKVEWGGHLR